MSSPTHIVCHDMICELPSDITLPSGVSIPAGTTVLMIPKTISDCVLVGNNTLTEELKNISRIGHAHVDDQANIASYCEQLIRYSNRLSLVENELALIKQKSI